MGGASLVHAQQPTAPTRENPPFEANSLESFVAQIVQNAEGVDCPSGNCKVLATDFAYPEGASNRVERELADVLSEQLSKGKQPFLVLDRSIFQSFILKEGLPSRSQSEPGVSIACWIARELKANTVIIGKIDKIEEASIELTARFLNVDERKRAALGVGATSCRDSPRPFLGGVNPACADLNVLTQLPFFNSASTIFASSFSVSNTPCP